MRRRVSLALTAFLAILVFVAAWQYRSTRTRGDSRLTSARARQDSAAQTDSARSDSLQGADTLCFAARLGMTCDPR